MLRGVTGWLVSDVSIKSGAFEMSGTNHPVTWCHIPGRRPRLFRCGKMKLAWSMDYLMTPFQTQDLYSVERNSKTLMNCDFGLSENKISVLVIVHWETPQKLIHNWLQHSPNRNRLSPEGSCYRAMLNLAARGGAVGWGIALQAGRLLEFFIDIIPPAALWPWGRLSL
jgi:hypothetical protein